MVRRKGLSRLLPLSLFGVLLDLVEFVAGRLCCCFMPTSELEGLSPFDAGDEPSPSRFFTRSSSLAILESSSESPFRRPPCRPLGNLEGAEKTHVMLDRWQFAHGSTLSHLILRFLHRLQLGRVCLTVWPCDTDVGVDPFCEAMANFQFLHHLLRLKENMKFGIEHIHIN